MNSINLIGNICNDLELKTTPSGKNVCSFNLAVKRPFTKDTTDFFPVVVWDRQAENVTKYAQKGTKVGVTGMLTSRSFTDKNGNNRTVIEIVASNVLFVTPKSADTSNSNEAEGKTFSKSKNTVDVEFEEMSGDMDLPF